jgi:hypothetical protein
MRTGQLILNNETSVDLAALSHPVFRKNYAAGLKHLQISGTPVTSLEGLPPLIHLRSFIADRTSIESFVNFSAIAHVTKISLKGTPVARLSNYKLSLLLICGSNLTSIDGGCVPAALREKSATFPSYAGAFVSKGWQVQVPCPDRETWDHLSQQYDIPLPGEQKPDSPQQPAAGQPEIEPFETIAQQIRERQEAMFAKAEERLEIQKQIDEEDQLAEGIATLLQEVGIAVDPNNEDDLVEEVWKLCRKAAQTREALSKKDEDD